MTMTYVDYDGIPARITQQDDGAMVAEMYLAGQGFVAGNLADILFHGYALSAKEFEQMVINLRRLT